MIKLDYSLETAEERNELVKKIISENKITNQNDLSKLADYIIYPVSKQERSKARLSKKILTKNRQITLDNRETSYEGLVSKLENGEEGVYNMITNDKNILFKPKKPITEDDINSIPELKELDNQIKLAEERLKKMPSSHAKFVLKKQIIEMYKDRYVIKDCYRPAKKSNSQKSTTIAKNLNQIDLLVGETTILSDGTIKDTSPLNFFEERHISTLLCNYSNIKQESWEDSNGVLKWVMEDLDDLIERNLKDKYSYYYDLLILKIDGCANEDIRKQLLKKYNINYTTEYLSSIWRKKIPKILKEAAVNEYLEWYYTFKEKGQWKKCSKCGKVKLAHNNFFSKNSGSADGFYSICKECRNTKYKEGGDI